MPLRANVVFLPDSAYQQSTGLFVPIGNATTNDNGDFAFPRWGLMVTNRLQVVMVDSQTDRVIDYTQLKGLNTYLDLAGKIAQNPMNLFYNGLWGTNALGDYLTDQPGVIQQILFSLGYGDVGDNWNDYGIAQATGSTRFKEIARFTAFFSPSHIASYGGFYSTNYDQFTTAPFSPSVKISPPLAWQANDPLVHYLSDDLLDLGTTNVPMFWNLKFIPDHRTMANIGYRNVRYHPWGSTIPSSDPNTFNLAIKDPLVWSSDDWNFPDSEPLSLGMLSRVHRGTPWQTVYLKSADIDPVTWQRWTGNRDSTDAHLTWPKRDWSLVSLISSLINMNDPRRLVSVNESNTNIWLAAMDGIVALTNSPPDYGVPVTMTSNLPQSAILVEGILSARASQPNQRFNDLGAILAVSQLSVASPWLDLSSTQLQYGITDEAYETIPAQLLPRLRADSVGSIYETGDLLKIQFTGFDDYPYAVETSSNLVNWLAISTNCPTNGVFELTEPLGCETGRRFYRSVFLQ